MLRWGIIGLGRIADTEIAPAITASPQGELRGVVSRDQGRAEAFAGRHGAVRALTSFDELLADPEVDAVYIATPNALHADEVVAAAAAGKHVMCDKPLALSVAGAQRADAAEGLADRPGAGGPRRRQQPRRARLRPDRLAARGRADRGDRPGRARGRL